MIMTAALSDLKLKDFLLLILSDYQFYSIVYCILDNFRPLNEEELVILLKQEVNPNSKW